MFTIFLPPQKKNVEEKSYIPSNVRKHVHLDFHYII